MSLKLYKLHTEPNIFTLVSQATTEAANTMTTNKILIICDFQSALLALESPNSSNEIIQQIYNIIVKTNKIIKFM